MERQLKIPEGTELPTAVRALSWTHGVGLGGPCSPPPPTPFLGSGLGGAQERLHSQTGVLTPPSHPQYMVFQEQREGLLEESGMRKMRRRRQSLGMRQTQPHGRRRRWSSSTGGRRKSEPWCEDGFGEDAHMMAQGVCVGSAGFLTQLCLQAAWQCQEKPAWCWRQELFRLCSLRWQVKRWEAELLRRRQAHLGKHQVKDVLPQCLGPLK